MISSEMFLKSLNINMRNIHKEVNKQGTSEINLCYKRDQKLIFVISTVITKIRSVTIYSY